MMRAGEMTAPDAGSDAFKVAAFVLVAVAVYVLMRRRHRQEEAQAAADAANSVIEDEIFARDFANAGDDDQEEVAA